MRFKYIGDMEDDELVAVATDSAVMFWNLADVAPTNDFAVIVVTTDEMIDQYPRQLMWTRDVYTIAQDCLPIWIEFITDRGNVYYGIVTEATEDSFMVNGRWVHHNRGLCILDFEREEHMDS